MRHLDLEALEDLPAYEPNRKPEKRKRNDHAKPRALKPWQSVREDREAA